MRIQVINLRRRPDRRDFMDGQAKHLGLSFDYLDAVDAKNTDMAAHRRQASAGPLGHLSDGDLCCFLSHRKAWQNIHDGTDPFGVILEDDAVLSDDAAAFLQNNSWIPKGQTCIKLERHGNNRHRVVFKRFDFSVQGRKLTRFLSKHCGSCAYILSREAAGHLIDATQTINLSIDHFLFNPNNSPVFKRLRPSQILPAIAEQGGDVAASDIHGMRLTQRTYTLAYWQREAIRGLYEIRHIPKFILLAMRGRVKLEKVIFDPSGTRAA